METDLQLHDESDYEFIEIRKTIILKIIDIIKAHDDLAEFSDAFMKSVLKQMQIASNGFDLTKFHVTST